MVIGKRLYAVDVVAKEGVKLESGKVVMVRVGWKGKSVDMRRIAYVDGEEACYRVRRVAAMCNGIVNGDGESMICLEMRPNVKKEKIRSVEKGDVLGKVYTVLDDRDMVNEEVPVGISEEENEWTQERLKE